MTNQIAVIIPTYNDGERLTLCLDSLTRQSYPQELITIYVVDNNSQQDIRAITQQYNNCVYLKEEKAGAYCARNHAIRNLAQEQLIAFTDADCIADEDWLTNAAKALAVEQRQAVGGKVKVFAVSPHPNTVEWYEILFAFPQQLYIEQDRFAVTANLVITRLALDKLGGFDETLFSGGDAQWGSRMHDNNIPLTYAPDVIVNHPARSTIKQLTSKVMRTVGGCYSQRKYNAVMRDSFTLSALLYGFAPPVRAIRQTLRSEQLSAGKKCKMIGLLFYLKYHKNLIKIAYRLKLIRQFERF